MSSELDVSSETQLGTSASAVATSSESPNEQSPNRNHDGPFATSVTEEELVDYNEDVDPELNPSLASAKGDDELTDYNDSDPDGKDAVEAAPADSSDQMSNGESDQVPVPIITGPCFPLMNEDGTMRDPKDLTWQDLLQVLHARMKPVPIPTDGSTPSTLPQWEGCNVSETLQNMFSMDSDSAKELIKVLETHTFTKGIVNMSRTDTATAVEKLTADGKDALQLPKGMADDLILVNANDYVRSTCIISMLEKLTNNWSTSDKPFGNTGICAELSDATSSEEVARLQSTFEHIHLVRALDVLAQNCLNTDQDPQRALLSNFSALNSNYRSGDTLQEVYVERANAATATLEANEHCRSQLEDDLTACSVGTANSRKIAADAMCKTLWDTMASVGELTTAAHSAHVHTAHMGSRALDLSLENQHLREQIFELRKTSHMLSEQILRESHISHVLSEELEVTQQVNLRQNEHHKFIAADHRRLVKCIRTHVEVMAQSGTFDVEGHTVRELQDLVTAADPKANPAYGLSAGYRTELGLRAPIKGFNVQAACSTSEKTQQLTKRLKRFPMRQNTQGRPPVGVTARTAHTNMKRILVDQSLRRDFVDFNQVKRGERPPKHYSTSLSLLPNYGTNDPLPDFNDPDVVSTFEKANKFLVIEKVLVNELHTTHQKTLNKETGLPRYKSTRQVSTACLVQADECKHSLRECFAPSRNGRFANETSSSINQCSIMGQASQKWLFNNNSRFKPNVAKYVKAKATRRMKGDDDDELPITTYGSDIESDESDNESITSVTSELNDLGDAMDPAVTSRNLRDKEEVDDTNADDDNADDENDFGGDNNDDDADNTSDSDSNASAKDDKSSDDDANDSGGSDDETDNLAIATISGSALQNRTGKLSLSSTGYFQVTTTRDSKQPLRPFFQFVMWRNATNKKIGSYWQIYNINSSDGTSQFPPNVTEVVPTPRLRSLQKTLSYLESRSKEPALYQTAFTTSDLLKGAKGKGKDKGSKGKSKGKDKGRSRGRGNNGYFDKPETPTKKEQDSKLSGETKKDIEKVRQELDPKAVNQYCWLDTAHGAYLNGPWMSLLKDAKFKSKAIDVSDDGAILLDLSLVAPHLARNGKSRQDNSMQNNPLRAFYPQGKKPGCEGENVVRALISFPHSFRLDFLNHSGYEYQVSIQPPAVKDKGKLKGSLVKKKTITLSENLALACRFNLYTGRIEYFPGSYRPYEDGFPRSSLLGSENELYKHLGLWNSSTGTISSSKDWNLAKPGIITGELDPNKEGLSLRVHFVVFHAWNYIPCDQAPFLEAMAMEDRNEEETAEPYIHPKRFDAMDLEMKRLIKMAPTHYHHALYSIQHHIMKLHLHSLYKSVNKKRKRETSKSGTFKDINGETLDDKGDDSEEPRSSNSNQKDPEETSSSKKKKGNPNQVVHRTNSEGPQKKLDRDRMKATKEAQQKKQKKSARTSKDKEPKAKKVPVNVNSVGEASKK